MIPEIIIKRMIDSCIKVVREDFRLSADERETVLYSIFGEEKYDKLSFFNQAKDLLINRGVEDKRRVETRLMFDKDRAMLPTLHITVPTGEPVDNVIGFDPEIVNDEGRVYMTYGRRYRKKVSVVITSENSFECIILSTFVQCMLISIVDTFQAFDLYNMSMTERELSMNSQQLPMGSFIRMVDITFDYDQRVKIGQDVIFNINKLIVGGSAGDGA